MPQISITKCVWKSQFWDTCTARSHNGYWMSLKTNSFVLAPANLLTHIWYTIIYNAPATVYFHADNKQRAFKRCSVYVIGQEGETHIGLVLHRDRCNRKLVVITSALAIKRYVPYRILHVHWRVGNDIIYLFMSLNRKLCIIYKSSHCIPSIYVFTSVASINVHRIRETLIRSPCLCICWFILQHIVIHACASSRNIVQFIIKYQRK